MCSISDAAVLQQYDLVKERELGSGTYGCVFVARNTKTRDVVAVKQMYVDQGDEGVPSTVLREVSLCSELDHPNIVQLLDVIQSRGKFFIIYEVCYTDLKKIIGYNPKTNSSPSHNPTLHIP